MGMGLLPNLEEKIYVARSMRVREAVYASIAICEVYGWYGRIQSYQ